MQTAQGSRGMLLDSHPQLSLTSLLYSYSPLKFAAINCGRRRTTTAIRNPNLTGSPSLPPTLSSSARRSYNNANFSNSKAYGDDNITTDAGDDGDGIELEIDETGKNRRRIRSRVPVEASLQTLWNILTDYERLADFIPGLAVSQLLLKRDNFARLFQIGQQNLAFGLKFKAKGVIDCYEKDTEFFPFGQRRDIEFKMIEGDFQLFEGKWSVEQKNTGKDYRSDTIVGQEFNTTLSYFVVVEPKVWLPVRLVQGRLCREIKMNLSCIRKAAEREFHSRGSAC